LVALDGDIGIAREPATVGRVGRLEGEEDALRRVLEDVVAEEDSFEERWKI
jgi:hypothetical protein